MLPAGVPFSLALAPLGLTTIEQHRVLRVPVTWERSFASLLLAFPIPSLTAEEVQLRDSLRSQTAWE